MSCCEHPSLELVDTGLLSINACDGPTGKRCCHPLRTSARGIFSGQVPVHASVFARTEWFRANRYDPRYRRAQDLELWCRVLSAGRLVVRRLPLPLYFVREADFVTYAKVRATYAAQREILGRHGPRLVGWRRTQIELAKIGLRQLVHRCADLCGAHTQLVARRNQPLSVSERQAMGDVIAGILQTPVPGLADDERRPTPCQAPRQAA